MKTQIYCDPARAYIICVDSYENKILRGRIHNILLDSSVPFTGAVDMLLKMESLLDQSKLVQSYSVKRAFSPNRLTETETSGTTASDGKTATFTLRLLFRQNVSWQGSVLWHEGNSEETFRSVLELLILMDNALSGETV
jgi:hypothetical protein